MAGYSGTPLPKKLGLKPGHRFVIMGAPWGGGWPKEYGDLPAEVRPAARLPAGRRADIVLAFFTGAAALGRRISRLAGAIKPDGAVWIACPKRAAKMETDLTDNVVRQVGLAAGLVDVKVCAIDATWSGLKFVYRVRDRAKLTAGVNQKNSSSRL